MEKITASPNNSIKKWKLMLKVILENGGEAPTTKIMEELNMPNVNVNRVGQHLISFSMLRKEKRIERVGKTITPLNYWIIRPQRMEQTISLLKKEGLILQ